MHPQITVVMPTFNPSVDQLTEALISLAQQSFTEFEVFVVDDSDDMECAQACARICRMDGRFKYFRNERKLGLAGSLNRGIAFSNSNYIARMDSDDKSHPDRLKLQFEFLERNPEIGVCGSWLNIILDGSVEAHIRKYPITHEEIVRGFLFKNAIGHPSVMMRRNISDLAYDVSFLQCEDLELWLRLLNNGVQFANIADPLIQYRAAATARSNENWAYNIRARVKNLATPFLARKSLAIAAISIWFLTPNVLRSAIYKVYFYYAYRNQS